MYNVVFNRWCVHAITHFMLKNMCAMKNNTYFWLFPVLHWLWGHYLFTYIVINFVRPFLTYVCICAQRCTVMFNIACEWPLISAHHRKRYALNEISVTFLAHEFYQDWPLKYDMSLSLDIVNHQKAIHTHKN